MLYIMSMNTVHLPSVDLNLLVALDALLLEASVTRAAKRVGITQSAMSHALARLRELFRDPLLVRTPKGMTPTTRAMGLIEPIRHALGEIERAIAERPTFEPSTARRTFTLAMQDYGELLLLPPLLSRLGTAAPAVDLIARPVSDDAALMLEEGSVELAVGPLIPERVGVFRQRLFEERFVCVVREGHPLVRGRMTLDRFVSLPHLLIAPRGHGRGAVDAALAKLGRERRVALMVPHFLVAPHIVAQSDLCLTVAARIARTFASMLPLRIVEPPIELPGFTMWQGWHERWSHDPGHSWLRGVLAQLSRTI
jgi:DNA-binding transcriptional LysR family regulator